MGRVCVPRVDEFYRRGRDLEERIRNRDFKMHPLGRYLLNTEAVRMRAKKFNTREEQLQVLPQLREQFPLMQESLIPRPDEKTLPPILSDLVRDQRFWRLEWFFNGMGLVKESDDWRELLHVPRRKLAEKIASMGGFLWADAMMRVWSDSLYYPDTIIWYEGMAWYCEDVGLVKQRVSMVSHVYDLDHVVVGMIIESV